MKYRRATRRPDTEQPIEPPGQEAEDGRGEAAAASLEQLHLSAADAAEEAVRAFPRLYAMRQAREARMRREPLQMAWDVGVDPGEMLQSLKRAGPLLPPRYLADALSQILRRATGGSFSDRRAGPAVHAVVRALRAGEIGLAIEALMSIRLVLSCRGQEDVRAVLCQAIRGVYPHPPEGYVPEPGAMQRVADRAKRTQ